LFRLMTPEQQGRLMDNIAAAMTGVPKDIVERQVALFAQCDPAYGAGVAARMGVAVRSAQAAE
jgi:catalase